MCVVPAKYVRDAAAGILIFGSRSKLSIEAAWALTLFRADVWIDDFAGVVVLYKSSDIVGRTSCGSGDCTVLCFRLLLAGPPMLLRGHHMSVAYACLIVTPELLIFSDSNNQNARTGAIL